MLNGSVRAHKVRAIGVSNYCRACMECLADAEVKPMVNQVHYQVGMGPDPQGFKSYAASQGFVLQAYIRTPVNNIEYFPPNFEGLVLGCIDADFCK